MTASVIIPTQGKRDTLLETVESVYKQTRKPKEVIIVFPEREDETSWSKFNRGIKQSTADAFIPLADDDLLDPTYIEKTLGLMEQTGADIVATALTNFGDDTGVHQPGRHPFGTALYTKKVWEQVGGYDETVGIAADADFGHQAQKLGKRVDISEGLFFYRNHPGTWTRTASQQEWEQSLNNVRNKL